MPQKMRDRGKMKRVSWACVCGRGYRNNEMVCMLIFLNGIIQ
jgi:hypothetical protein